MSSLLQSAPLVIMFAVASAGAIPFGVRRMYSAERRISNEALDGFFANKNNHTIRKSRTNGIWSLELLGNSILPYI
jgi:hypothetical protein